MAQLAHLQGKLRERWRSQQPENGWAARNRGALPQADMLAWDSFDHELASSAEKPASESEPVDARGKKDKKKRKKSKEMSVDSDTWIDPSALNAAGLAVGKRLVMDAAGELVRSSHGARRDRERQARREEKRAAKRQRLASDAGAASAGGHDEATHPCAPDVATGSPSAVLTVDPFHGRLVLAAELPRAKVGSKRRKRRKRLEQVMAAPAAAPSAAPATAPSAASAAAPATPAAPVPVAPAAPAREELAASRSVASTARELAAESRATAVSKNGEGAGVGCGGSHGQPQQRRPPRKQFPYGNYDAYYGYRYVGGEDGGGGAVDPRLLAIDRAWLHGKDCLDVGCNAGQFTSSLATRFGVRSMLGVDIDASLVQRAQQLLRHSVSVGPPPAIATRGEPLVPPPPVPPPPAPPAPALPPPDVAAGNLSNEDFRRLLLGPRPAATAAVKAPAEAAEPPARAPPSHRASSGSLHDDRQTTDATGHYPGNMRFEHCDFVQEPPDPQQLGVGPSAARFDVVSCFSTSKWVHLNFGDEGLRRLFVRAHACLRPGGRFLLEPQPWSSYRKRAGLTPTIKRNYEQIRLRPDSFCAYLTSEAVGFATARTIEVPYGDEAAKNFKRRPLIVCMKAPREA